MISRHKEDEGLEMMINTLAEFVLEMPDESILAEADGGGEQGEWKEGAEVCAARTRSLLLQSVKSYRQRHLTQAMGDYAEQVAEMQRRSYEMPATPDMRRELLASIFQRYPQMHSAFLTVQHREFKELSDSDVESFLKQLQELGVSQSWKEESGGDD